MASGKRVTPFKQKAREGEEKSSKTSQIELIRIDAAKSRARLELITDDEMARVQQAVAHNALNLFNDLISEMQKRIPQMTNEVLTASLYSVWDKVNTSNGANEEN